jgi:CheY-like chemotaxis protein
MPSLTRILIVEDDSYKREGVETLLRELIRTPITVESCDAISTARLALARDKFDLVIVDMSIPSHPPVVGEGSPFSFPSGGLDVLFEIDELGHSSKCIVLTQYPEIEMDGVLVPVASATEQIEIKFGIRVAACIQYFEDNPSWKLQIASCLDKA